MPCNISEERLNEIMTYCNEHGETNTCEYFGINSETLHRYQRQKRFHETKNPKILLFDIENSTLHARAWRTGKQYITSDQIIDDWFVLGYSARWLFSAETMSDFVTAKEAVQRDDKRIMQSLYKLINECDILISHNGLKHDIPMVKTRFFLHGFKPPLPFMVIDTLKVAWKEFAFSSAKLDYLGKMILRKQKLHTDYNLWIRCENGDQEALDYMEEYCRVDTELLESIYCEMRPWMHSHPSLPLIMNAQEPACPTCGSFELKEESDYYYTPQNRYIAMRCLSCGAVSHQKKSDISKDQRKILLVPNAR